ncbi:MAG: tRNA (adenosine(37)-N6)-threonylcarbamoyltransferase complex transferase subunit TsaD, partial [Bacteroidales bacterium]|nr:tRNA (adenosine(37)-N6)-threonylcarbamoyltransferase complex transferase subunit TsaD [Bacteroidales bacterium]
PRARGLGDGYQSQLCACIQQAVVDTLLDKLIKAAEQHQIKDIAIGGGVSANSLLRSRIEACGRERGWRTFLPPFSYTTDNAAMVGMAGYFKWLQKDFCTLDTVPYTRQAR